MATVTGNALSVGSVTIEKNAQCSLPHFVRQYTAAAYKSKNCIINTFYSLFYSISGQHGPRPHTTRKFKTDKQDKQANTTQPVQVKTTQNTEIYHHGISDSAVGRQLSGILDSTALKGKCTPTDASHMDSTPVQKQTNKAKH